MNAFRSAVFSLLVLLVLVWFTPPVAGAEPAAAARKGDKDKGDLPELVPAGYEVPPGARDPFFPVRPAVSTPEPVTPAGETGTTAAGAAEPVPLAPAVPEVRVPAPSASGPAVRELGAAVSVSIVFSGAEGAAAIVNGEVVRTGGRVQVKVGEEKIALEVTRIDLEPPRVAFRHGTTEFAKTLGPEAEKGENK